MTAAQLGTIEAALDRARALLQANPAGAVAQAREVLAAVPTHPIARLLLAAGLRQSGDLTQALDVIAPLAQEQPKAKAAWLELARVQLGLGHATDAVSALKRALVLDQNHLEAWTMLLPLCQAMGDEEGARTASAQLLRLAVRDPQLLAAAQALCSNDLPQAEHGLRTILRQQPDNILAIRMLAEIGARLGRYGEAQAMLEHCLALDPAFTSALHNYAVVLHRQNMWPEALAQIALLSKDDADNPSYLALRGAVLGQIGEYEESVRCYQALVAKLPDQPKAWLSYGHALKALGRQADCIAAYRKAAALSPGFGEAWWSLANLKTFRFTDAEVAQIAHQHQANTESAEDKFHLQFTLAKIREDQKDFAQAFRDYVDANALRRKSLPYSADETASHVDRNISLFSQAFFDDRAAYGCKAQDPIFILGLPRAGSTLVEQILASHSVVEGTMELPDIGAIARRLAGRRRDDPTRYAQILSDMSGDDIAALGEEYLQRTRIQRKTSKPLFIDKMPNNWAHVGLIQLILPNAKIIDARRHPVACCFSAFKQHFARGQGFSYDLQDVARYYQDYVRLMAHFDAIRPGRIYRIYHERLVADPQAQIRALLAACGLPFEEACLSFHENKRAVRTASSEQVRRPISSEGVAQWMNFRPWIASLEHALAAQAAAYPA